MAVNYAKPFDITGRVIGGVDPFVIPSGTESQNGTITKDGIKVNQTTGGLDVWFNGNRVSLVGQNQAQVPTVELGPGATYSPKANDIVPIRFTQANMEANIVLPAAVKTGERVTLYDAGLMFDAQTTLVFQNVVIEGENLTRRFAIKGGSLEFEYVGGSIGWRVDSTDKLVPYIHDVTNHTNELTFGPITRGGVYRVAVSGATAVCPVDHRKISVGERVYVWFTKGASFSLIHGSVHSVLNAPRLRLCHAAYVTYLKVVDGLVIENVYYQDTLNTSMTNINNIITSQGVGALGGMTCPNFDLTVWSYLGDSTQYLKNLLPKQTPVSFMQFSGNARVPGNYTIPDNPAKLNRVKSILMQMDGYDGLVSLSERYSSDGSTKLSPLTLDVGKEVTIEIPIDGLRKIQRISHRMKFFIKAKDCILDLKDNAVNFHIGDEITIVNAQKFFGTKDKTTVILSTDTVGNDVYMTENTDEPSVRELVMTGAGISVIRKRSDYEWELVASSPL